jgi:carboxyl-terminal processing protease
MEPYFGPPKGPTQASAKTYAVVLLLIGMFCLGLYVGHSQSAASTQDGSDRLVNTGGSSRAASKDIDFNLFWQVWNDIKSNYVKQPVDEVSLFYGAMRGMVAALNDPYSDFFDPQTAKEFDQELSGTFSGIGVEVGKRNGTIVVIAPLDGSPGAEAGLKAGDIILAIDKNNAIDMPLDRAVSLIRGEEGTTVNLTVLSKGAKQPHAVAVVRKKIEHVSMRWSYKEDTAIVKLTGFDEDTTQLLNKFVQEVQGKPAIKHIILDMRNDPGGFLDKAIDVASQWIENGVIVRERDHDGTERDHQANGAARLAKYATVILVNEGSASAAEIVAGALQDEGKAVLVGKTTFGKGSVQKYETLADGSAFKMTVAKWFTPKERAIDEVGIKPDYEVDLTEQDFNAERDPQMEKAWALLHTAH